MYQIVMQKRKWHLGIKVRYLFGLIRIEAKSYRDNSKEMGSGLGQLEFEGVNRPVNAGTTKVQRRV